MTPKSIRLRKVELSAGKRQTLASRRKRERDAAPALDKLRRCGVGLIRAASFIFVAAQ